MGNTKIRNLWMVTAAAFFWALVGPSGVGWNTLGKKNNRQLNKVSWNQLPMFIITLTKRQGVALYIIIRKERNNVTHSKISWWACTCFICCPCLSASLFCLQNNWNAQYTKWAELFSGTESGNVILISRRAVANIRSLLQREVLWDN